MVRVVPLSHVAAAAALAEDGLLTRAQLARARLSADVADRMARQHRWRRLAPSVWLTSSEPPADRQLVRAALLHAGPDAVVTGTLACRALGLAYAPADGTVEVLVPPGRRRTSSAYVRVQQTTAPVPWWTSGDVRLALPDRAVVDAARRLADLRRVRALVAEATDRLCTVDGLAACLEQGPSAGSAVVRRALRDLALGARSAPEAELADVARAAVRDGLLPPFLLNPTLLLDGRVLGLPDGWFPGLGLGWEVDSRLHHAEEGDFDRTLARHDRFARHGLVLLHVTPRRLRLLGPQYVDVLVEAVAARRLSGQPEPKGLVVQPSGRLAA